MEQWNTQAYQSTPQVTLKSVLDTVRIITRAPKVELAVNPETHLFKLLDKWRFEKREGAMGLYGLPVHEDETVPVDALRIREEGKPEFFVR